MEEINVKKGQEENKDEETSKTRLYSDESMKKAETLFSKKFIQYLSTKKQNEESEMDLPKLYNPGLSLPLKENVPSVTTSSDETSTSESSKRYVRKIRRKLRDRPSLRAVDYHAFRNKLIQCSLLKQEEEVAPPVELKPLLLNMTVLLQEIKQSPNIYNLYNLISKITILTTELVRRPFKRIQEEKKMEHAKNLQQHVEKIMELLEEYKSSPGWHLDNELVEFKKYEREIGTKDKLIKELKKRLSEEKMKFEGKPADINLRVANSILYNIGLESEIKFNQSHIKKYKKLLLDKEWTKHKLQNEINVLRKKLRTDSSDTEMLDKSFDSLESIPKSETSDSSKQITNFRKKKEKIKVKGKTKESDRKKS